MDKKTRPEKWIALFFAILFGLTVFCSAVTFIVDPFFQYRVKENNAYMLNGRYVSAGLIKNYDYDTIFIGSSMIQNNNADVIRSELKAKPLNIGVGGMNTDLEIKYIELANKTGRAKDYYICIDIANFTKTEQDETKAYLIEDGFPAKLQYSFSYESWFRFIPVDIGLSLVKKTGVNLPVKFQERTSIDRLEYWASDFEFSEKAAIDNYLSKRYNVSAVDTNNLQNRMLENADEFIEAIDFSKGNYTFFFPPYSSLFWSHAQENNYFAEYVKTKEYCIEKLCEKGARVFDFQAQGFTMDLNNYKDMTHYSPEINDYMIRCFADGECSVSPVNSSKNTQQLKENTLKFKMQHSELFE